MRVRALGRAVLGGLSVLLLVFLALSFASPPLDAGSRATAAVTNHRATNPACDVDMPVLAEYQAWHGLPNHLQPPPYYSTDPAVITGHISSAQRHCIDAFVVNWYGRPGAGLPNDADRAFIDEATGKLVTAAERYGFKVAILYDEGTLTGVNQMTTSQVVSDLLYASQYFSRTSYLRQAERPVLFVFPYETVDPAVDWDIVRAALGMEIVLIDKDPNPIDPAHDAAFDGFYAWVQPGRMWEADGTDWGEEYLIWFYNTMANAPYADAVTVGSVWPGFDDSLASWGRHRYMWPRCGQTWLDTWRLARLYAPDYVMIDTWNDFEEGTAIEFGVGECLAPALLRCGTPGERVVFTHTLANTGRLTDTFDLEAHSTRGWPLATRVGQVTLGGRAAASMAITVTLPATAVIAMRDTVVVTATSHLSPAVYNRLLDTTTILCPAFLPLVSVQE